MSEILSANHNGADPAEAQRVRNEHPDEEECVAKDRVCSVIAVTRGEANIPNSFLTGSLTGTISNWRPSFQITSDLL